MIIYKLAVCVLDFVCQNLDATVDVFVDGHLIGVYYLCRCVREARAASSEE